MEVVGRGGRGKHPCFYRENTGICCFYSTITAKIADHISLLISEWGIITPRGIYEQGMASY